MSVYWNLAVFINFLVDFMLLLGANRLSGFPASSGRCLLTATIGGLYAGGCLLPGFRFLSSLFWRLVILIVMSMVAFGFGVSALRRGIVFILLRMALGGISTGLEDTGFVTLLLSAGAVCLLCVLGFQSSVGDRKYVQLELCHGGRQETVLALQDTGNTLCDPVTGQSVIVVGPEVAASLLGLTKQQLRCPVETVASGVVPGLRLIPYRSVGQEYGMLAALRLQQVRIGKWSGSTVVAFAPAGLDREGTYQALTGGIA